MFLPALLPSRQHGPPDGGRTLFRGASIDLAPPCGGPSSLDISPPRGEDLVTVDYYKHSTTPWLHALLAGGPMYNLKSSLQNASWKPWFHSLISSYSSMVAPWAPLYWHSRACCARRHARR